MNQTSGGNEQKQNQIAMQAKIDSLESAVRELTALYKSGAQGSNRSQGGGFKPGGRPRWEVNKQRSQNVICFECGEKGHYARDCKAKKNKDESAKGLNGKGVGVRPIPDPVSRSPFEGGSGFRCHPHGRGKGVGPPDR